MVISEECLRSHWQIGRLTTSGYITIKLISRKKLARYTIVTSNKNNVKVSFIRGTCNLLSNNMLLSKFHNPFLADTFMEQHESMNLTTHHVNACTKNVLAASCHNKENCNPFHFAY